MDSGRPKLSEVAGENDDTTQMEDGKRRHIQGCHLSAEEEDDKVVLPSFHFLLTDEEFLGRKAEKKPMNAEVAGENDDTTQLVDGKRRLFEGCHLSAEEEDDKVVLPDFRVLPMVEAILGRKAEKKPMNAEKIDLNNKSVSWIFSRPAGHPHLNCPRCNSQNTKSSHINFFSPFPPRHFCKNCRRHFTEGDTLQNIRSSSATSNRPSSAASTSKNERENSNNRGKTAETSPLKGNPDPSTVGYDHKEWHLHDQTGRKYRDVGPNTVTGSGFWEPTGTKTPPYYSNGTPSRPNYTSMDNQPQPSEPPPSNQHPARPEVRIDVSDGKTDISLIHQSLKECKDNLDQLKNSLCDDDAVKIMSGTLTAVAVQFIGGLMVHRIASSAAAPYSWAGSAVETAMVLGLCATLAGISLRGRSRAHSALMIKIGAVIVASAVIFSMGLNLPPAVALTVGPVAFFIMVVAAAFA